MDSVSVSCLDIVADLVDVEICVFSTHIQVLVTF